MLIISLYLLFIRKNWFFMSCLKVFKEADVFSDFHRLIIVFRCFHRLEARTERTSLIKVCLKSGQNHYCERPLKDEGVQVLLKLLTEGLKIY